MSFAHPYILLSLWAVAPLLLIVYWGISRRRKIMTGYAAGEGLARLTGESSRFRRAAGALLPVLAAALALVALAGPRYGYRWEKIEQKGVDIIVALDCSASMLAEDIKPTRLTRAKYEIIDLLRMMAGDRLGLVAFSGTAFLQCPLTLDYSAFHLFLEALSPDMLPVGGTDLGEAVLTAMSGFDEKDPSEKAVILITDGERTIGPDPLETARQAADRKIKIFCIGVGEGQGAPVPETAGGFKKDREGKIVLTRLDEETLKQMAAVTDGIYVRSVAGDMDLEMIYQDKIRGTMEQTTLESGKKKIWEDRFQWFLALALLCLAIEMLMPKGRTMTALLVLLLLGAGAPGAQAGSVYNDVRQGREAYNGGQYEQALKHFIDAQLANPDNARLYYNIGGAYYKAGKYEEAANHYKKALDMAQDDDQFRENVLYNLGNVYFKQKDYKSAIESYQQALKIDSADKEAEENLALARKAAEEEKKPPEQQDNKEQQQDQQDQSDKEQQRGKGQRQERNGGQQSEKGGEDQSQAGQDQGAAPDKDKDLPDKQEGKAQGTGDDQEQEQQQAAAQAVNQGSEQQGRQQPGQAGQGDNRLNRLQDLPGAAMIIPPDYRKREVEQDW